mmetsp:Transcript_2157/g.5055  ORF Transcript_2157/g.5055 Transcript_2157/m.5055 type:complete len:275 (-) Transcript_2157:294-1118(-)
MPALRCLLLAEALLFQPRGYQASGIPPRGHGRGNAEGPAALHARHGLPGLHLVLGSQEGQPRPRLRECHRRVHEDDSPAARLLSGHSSPPQRPRAEHLEVDDHRRLPLLDVLSLLRFGLHGSRLPGRRARRAARGPLLVHDQNAPLRLHALWHVAHGRHAEDDRRSGRAGVLSPGVPQVPGKGAGRTGSSQHLPNLGPLSCGDVRFGLGRASSGRQREAQASQHLQQEARKPRLHGPHVCASSRGQRGRRHRPPQTLRRPTPQRYRRHGEETIL